MRTRCYQLFALANILLLLSNLSLYTTGHSLGLRSLKNSEIVDRYIRILFYFTTS